MLGSLGDIVFVASHNLLRTFSGFSRSGAPRVAEHEVIARKAQPEFLAPANESIGFQMRLDAAYGVSPQQELQRLRQYRDTGRILPLMIGGAYLGEWYVAGLSEAHPRFDKHGRTRVADVDVQLKEVPANEDPINTIAAMEAAEGEGGTREGVY